MNNFKWNKTKENLGSFWHSQKQEIVPYKEESVSDKDFIKLGQYEFRLYIEALCRIVSELVEIEEKRNLK